MGNRANLRRARGMLSVLGLLLVPWIHASADDGTAQMPLFKMSPPKPRSDFYVKVDTGGVFFRPPNKDNSNFSEGVNPAPTDGGASLGSQSGNDTTWRLGGTVGFYLPVQTDPWMGANLRVEASGDYFSTSNTQNANLTVSPAGNFVTVGRLDGTYSLTSQSTDIGSLSAGPNPVAAETLTTRDEFYESGVAVRSDYLADYGRIVLSPKLGFGYSNLNQNFDTTASGTRGAVGQQENVATSYFGPKFDLELKVQLAKNFVYYAEGDVDPFYASSTYSGTQFGTSTRFGGGSLQNAAADSHDTFSFKAGLTTGFYYDFGPVIVKLGGGFEYWNYVASIEEASIPAGTDTVGVTGNSATVQPSHLISSDMLNPNIESSVIIPF